MNELQVFKFKGQAIDILLKEDVNFEFDGDFLIHGNQTAMQLGYERGTKAVQDHVDVEDKHLVKNLDILKQDFRKLNNAGEIFITESGFYSLAFNSKLPSAKEFTKWVKKEVLPKIRKTGGYVANEDLFIETYLPYVDENTKLVFKNTLSMVRKQNEIIAIQKSTIDKQDKEIEYKQDVIVGLVDEISLAEKRQILNRVVRYKGANYRERWNELYKQFEMKYHIESLKNKVEKYNKEHKPKLKNRLDYIDKVMNKIPDLYEIACKLYENDVKELAKNLYSLNEEVS